MKRNDIIRKHISVSWSTISTPSDKKSFDNFYQLIPIEALSRAKSEMMPDVMSVQDIWSWFGA